MTAVRSLLACVALSSSTGCYATIDRGRPPPTVDTTQPPADIRRRVDPPDPSEQRESHREVVFVQAPRVGGRHVEGESTTWAFGGDVGGWYGSNGTFGGLRGGATYVRDRGVTDATFGPAIGFPVLGNLGLAWAVDPIRRVHGAEANVELGGMYFRYRRYQDPGEQRIELGIIIPLGIQSISWYR